MFEAHIDTGDARLACSVAGDGPLVVCAHGFPDCERSFRHQVPALCEAGYRVATPTMRGYSPSTPSSRGRYDALSLGRDLLAVADELSPEAPVHLFGHDWGALAAYAAASLRPERVASIVTAAVPHPRSLPARMATPAQLRRSWYMAFFQLRGVAERALRKDDMALVERLWRAWSPGYRPPDDELRRIKDALAPHLEAVLGYYRALASPAVLLGEARRVVMARTKVPALYLHGAGDGCIGVELTRDLDRFYEAGLETAIVPGAGHFLHLERPDEVNRLLLRFLAAR